MIADIGGRRFEWGSRTYVMGIVNVTPASTMRRSQAWTCGASVVVCPLRLSVSVPPTVNATVLIAPAGIPLA